MSRSPVIPAGEPDQDMWSDPATGLLCRARRSPLDHWCGYVAVPPHLVDFMGDAYVDCDVHGGVTFAGSAVPLEGADYWIGFDCGHPSDLVPGMRYIIPGAVYRDLAFVHRQCAKIAAYVAGFEYRH